MSHIIIIMFVSFFITNNRNTLYTLHAKIHLKKLIMYFVLLLAEYKNSQRKYVIIFCSWMMMRIKRNELDESTKISNQPS